MIAGLRRGRAGSTPSVSPIGCARHGRAAHRSRRSRDAGSHHLPSPSRSTEHRVRRAPVCLLRRCQCSAADVTGQRHPRGHRRPRHHGTGRFPGGRTLWVDRDRACGVMVTRRDVGGGAHFGDRLSNSTAPTVYAVGRLCREDGCRVALSRYNSTEWCARHESGSAISVHRPLPRVDAAAPLPRTRRNRTRGTSDRAGVMPS